MTRRGAAAIALALAGSVLAVGAVVGLAPSTATVLVVRDPDGAELVRTSLRDRDPIVLRYRNSLYGSVVEERFEVRDGTLRLVELAADERAVLDEYYAVDGPVSRAVSGSARAWRAPPREPMALTELAIAATDLGERTLLLPDGRSIELWRHATDDRPTVRLTVEPAR